MDGGFDEWVNQGCPVDEASEAYIIDQDGNDTWIARIGDRKRHQRLGKVGEIIGWNHLCQWDDGSDTWVWRRGLPHPKVGQINQDTAYAQVRMRWEDGTESTVHDPDHLTGVDYLAPPPLALLSYDEMLAMPDPTWMVEGLLQDQTSALLFGKSNAFKSFLGIDIACSVATGTPWHGFAVNESQRVVYVATEGSRGVGKMRIPGWMEAHGIAADLRKKISLHRDEIALDLEEDAKKVIETCAYLGAMDRLERGERVGNLEPKGGVGLVVIDIFGASMSGPETSDETARAWVRNINLIMREVGCSVLVIAHTGWTEQHRARMHTHFWGSFDTRLIAEGDKDSLTTVMKVDRHKDADSDGEWGFRLEKVVGPTGLGTLVPRLCDEVETTQKRRVSGKPAVALQALSEALIDHGRTIAGPNYPTCPVVSLEDWKAMCCRHGLTDSDNPETIKKAFQRAKSALIDKGLVKQFDSHAWKVNTND